MYGESGQDILTGGVGDDVMYGGEGLDQIFGGLGNDKLFGGAGIDYLEGGNGNDDLHGGDDNDVLIGGRGDDNLYGENGDDVIAGMEGSDWMWGGGGVNEIYFDLLDWVDGDPAHRSLSSFPGFPRANSRAIGGRSRGRMLKRTPARRAATNSHSPLLAF